MKRKVLTMSWTKTVSFVFSGLALAASGFAAPREEALLAAAAADERADGLYEQGRQALEDSRWEKAVELFTRAAEMTPARADAALYWKAYGLGKLGRTADALRTLADLRARFAHSRWKDDAQALDIELRGASSRPVSPESAGDDELKLVALNAMLGSDSDKALPILEKLLKGSASPRVRERALFVLSQSDSPRAQQIVFEAARGGANPDLQRKAIEYLGIMDSPQSREALLQLMGGASDAQVRKAVLHAFLVSDEKDLMAQAARTEKDPQVRREAIQLLGAMGAEEELWQLFRTEVAREVKEATLQALAVGGSGQKLSEIARTEKDPALRRAAVKNLGIMDSEETGATLVAVYGSDQDPEVRAAAVEGLFIQDNSKALLELVRKEKDPRMKKELVQKLALMDDDEATAYLLGLLEK
jgi:HEAT repeat protein